MILQGEVEMVEIEDHNGQQYACKETGEIEDGDGQPCTWKVYSLNTVRAANVGTLRESW